MKSFFKIINQYVYPYRGYAGLNIFFNIWGVIFSLFSLVMIGPFLQILFGLQEITTSQVPFELTKQSIQHNFNFFLSQLIEQQGKPAALLFVSGLAVMMFFLKTSNIYLANYFMAPLRNGVVRDIRNRIYKQVVDLPLSYHTRERKGDIMARLTQDVQEVEWSVMASLEKFFRDPLNILIFLVGMFVMSPKLTVIVIILLPVSGILIGTVGKNLRKTSAKSQVQMGVLMSILEETLSGLRIIKGFNAGEWSEKRFRNENQVFTRIMNSITRRRDLASPLSEFLGSIVVVGLMMIGGNLVLKGQGGLNAPSFIAYIAIFSQILNPAKSLSTAYYHLNKGLASIDRINQVLDAPVTILDSPQAVEADRFNESIEFRNVSFAYGDQPVIRKVSLTIRKGETIALVGPSGSGKSTLADLLARFYEVQAGSVLIDGQDVRNIRTESLRNLIGIVPQDPLLFNDTIGSNIAFGDDHPDIQAICEAAKVAHAWEFIQQTEQGIETRLGDRGGTVSGGQRQRLCLARAVYRNPPILILDEATSSLDSESEKLVQESLQDLMRNRTTIVIAHRLSTIQYADRIYVIRDGQISEQGTHDELMNKHGDYRYMLDLQNNSIQ
ncbi:MAG: ABC transporter ATP-binding protein [Bacteroidota bacterium]